MLSESHNRAYQEFFILLKKFQNSCSNLDQKPQNTSIDQNFQQLQTFFQQNILPLTDAELDKAIALKWQSVQTEIKREFRLLSTDILFLNTSRQASTKDAKLQSVDQRIAKLINYCQIMLSERQEKSADEDENIVS